MPAAATARRSRTLCCRSHAAAAAVRTAFLNECFRHAQGQVVANNLAVKRHYMDPASNFQRVRGRTRTRVLCGGTPCHAARQMTFDPRFLMFEFTYNIMLRKARDAPALLLARPSLTPAGAQSQVDLVRQIIREASTSSLWSQRTFGL
jgi:hypothetical protein